MTMLQVDLLYGWKSDSENDIELVCQQQSAFTQNQFEKRCNQIIVQFAEQVLKFENNKQVDICIFLKWSNVALYYKNFDPTVFHSMVPVSARSGDGMGSLIALIIEKCQTDLAKRIAYTDELQATVMEVSAIASIPLGKIENLNSPQVKKDDDLGTTIDVVLVNGCLSVGDKVIIAGQEGPIVTRIRELLIPESNEEIRVTVNELNLLLNSSAILNSNLESIRKT